MTDKAPAYQWYPRDYMSDEAVALMSYEQRGIYRDLLDRQWLEGSIPADLSQLAAILRIPVSRFEKLWPQVSAKFKPAGEGRLVNTRMEREREKQDAYRELQRQKGISSGRARAKRQPDANHGSTTVPVRLEPEGNSSSALCSLQSATASAKSVSTRAPEPMPGRGSYLAESKLAYRHPSGYSLSRGPHYDTFLDRFDGSHERFHAWLDAEIEAAQARGERPGNLFKFIDERWEKRGVLPKQTQETVDNLSRFVARQQAKEAR
jgi:uncharacterized protein YdaU (DUF1376 family)